LLFHQKGFKYKYKEPGYEDEATYNLNYIELPILAKVKFGKFHAEAGPSFGYGIGGKYKGTYTDQGQSEDYDGKIKFGKEPDNSNFDDHYIDNALRVPGIYAEDRDGGTPRKRLLAGTPVLRVQDDVYTNHIHADDLARACIAALWRGLPQRIYNTNDDTRLRMGDYFDLAADRYGLPRPPRIARDAATAELPLGLLSFMRESRQMDNTRLKRELRLRLRYPTVSDGLHGD
jgi:dTDP-4-dehydrorhamnose reductase